MSAEILRRAAALMRERAEGATPGPWTCYGDHLVWPSEQGPASNDAILAMVGEAHEDSAQHTASWHPAVALAVADWLDTAGADLWAHGPLCECGSGCMDCDDSLWQPHARRALAVARAYLGEST